MAVDGARWRSSAKDRVDDARGKDASEDGAESAAGAVNAKCVKRIVVAEAGLDLEDHERAEETGRKADEKRGHGLHEAGSGRDGDQAGDRAGDCAQRGGLAIVKPLKDGPADGGGGRGEVGIDEGAGGERACAQGAAGVEAEPAHPQQAGADEAKHKRVRRHSRVRVTETLAEIERANQRRDAAGDVNDRSAGEVERGNVAASRVEQAADAQTMWAIGQYTRSDQSERNRAIELNFIRSANAPVMRAGVMMANINW